jgi:hypothetical protein
MFDSPSLVHDIYAAVSMHNGERSAGWLILKKFAANV